MNQNKICTYIEDYIKDNLVKYLYEDLSMIPKAHLKPKYTHILFHMWIVTSDFGFVCLNWNAHRNGSMKETVVQECREALKSM